MVQIGDALYLYISGFLAVAAIFAGFLRGKEAFDLYCWPLAYEFRRVSEWQIFCHLLQ